MATTVAGVTGTFALLLLLPMTFGGRPSFRALYGRRFAAAVLVSVAILAALFTLLKALVAWQIAWEWAYGLGAVGITAVYAALGWKRRARVFTAAALLVGSAGITGIVAVAHDLRQWSTTTDRVLLVPALPMLLAGVALLVTRLSR